MPVSVHSVWTQRKTNLKSEMTHCLVIDSEVLVTVCVFS